MLVVYINDILITRSNIVGIAQVKACLHRHLTIWDLGTPKYFLGIEFPYRLKKLVLNQQKYVLDILAEVGLLGCNLQALPIYSKPNLWDSTSPIFVDVYVCHKIVRKFIYLTVTCPNITHTMGLLSMFKHTLQEIHWQGTLHVLAYLKHARGHGGLL